MALLVVRGASVVCTGAPDCDGDAWATGPSSLSTGQAESAATVSARAVRLGLSVPTTSTASHDAVDLSDPTPAIVALGPDRSGAARVDLHATVAPTTRSRTGSTATA